MVNRELFNEIISYSQGIANPQTEELLKEWRKNKQNLINHILNGNMIYEYPQKITLELDQDSKLKSYENFVDIVKVRVYNPEFYEYLDSLSIDEFYSNILENDYIVSPDKTISKGTKIIKSFKHFFTDVTKLQEIQNLASYYIQSNKVEGILCFSVHPFDFLSSSENTHNWRSCHSLDGEYRAGNLSYMTDKSTMMVYLRSEEPANLPHFPASVKWNNKKWRCLFHFSDELNAVFAGRQYPFTSDSALDIIREIMIKNNLLKPSTDNRWLPLGWSHWHNDQIAEFEYTHFQEDSLYTNIDSKHSYVVINGNIFDMYDIIKDCKSGYEPLHYNDLLRSSVYTKPYYMFEISYQNKPISFHIGNEVTCLSCGEGLITNSDQMVCEGCDCDSSIFVTCDYCGAGTEQYELIDEDYVCPTCVANYTFVCDKCGERHHIQYRHYDSINSKCLCSNCITQEEE